MEPISTFIPYDVLCAIVACLDPETLKTIKLVGNRDLNYLADKHLWRRVRISPLYSYSFGNVSKIREASAILDRANRGSLVRHLLVHVCSTSRYPGAIDDIFPLLQETTHLQSLKLFASRGPDGSLDTEIAEVISSRPFSPLLSDILFYMPHSLVPLMADLWRSHPHITTLTWLDENNGELDTPFHFLTLLGHLDLLGLRGSDTLGPARGSTSILIVDFKHISEQILLGVHISSWYTALTMNLCTPHIPDRFTIVRDRLHHISYLEVNLDGFLSEDDERLAMNALASLRHLEILVWGWLSYKERLNHIEPLRYAGLSMKMATFRWQEGAEMEGRVSRSRTLRREGPASAWVVVEEHSSSINANSDSV